MKRFFALAALVLGLAACQTEPEGLDVNVGGEVDTTITVTLPDTETRADSAEGAFANVDFADYTIRYILQVYYKDQPSKERLVKYSDDKSVSFAVRLVPGRDYNFVVWADLVAEAEYTENEWYNEDGLHYDTKDLHNITLKENTWVAMDETRDAFTGYFNTADGDQRYSSNLPINITLTRPFAKLRVITTDMVELDNLGIEPHNAVATYTTKHYETFNACNGAYAGEVSDISHEYVIADYEETGANKTIFADYFFANNEVVNFTMEVFEENGNKIGETINFNTPIPAQRNYLTTIQGNILTDGNNVNVVINPAFDGYNNCVYPEVKNEFDLQAAINAAEDGINTFIYLANGIELTKTVNVPASKVVTLDLNGQKLTTAFVEGSETNHVYAFDNRGTLTIKDSKGNGEIIARGIFNYGTMTLESGKINACDGNGGYGVRNYAGTFVMNGGSIVTSLEDDNQVDKGGYDATTLRVDKGATATINGGTINNVCDYTFAIDNYGETTVNGGTMTSIHSTVSSYGNLTINGGSFTCDGKENVSSHVIVVWDGSETNIHGGTFDGKDNYNGFNVDACSGSVVNIYGGEFKKVHSGSLYGEGTINVMGGCFFDKPNDERLADGYVAIEAKNSDDTIKCYDVFKGEIVNGVTSVFIENTNDLDWLAEAVDNGNTFKDITVKLLNDIDLTGMTWNPIGDNRVSGAAFSGTFDGQNYTIRGASKSSIDGSNFGSKEGWGIFSVVKKATIKNLCVDNATFASYTVISGTIAGYAQNTTFENINITNTKVAGYDWYTGGVVGWASGECTFKGINLDNNTAVGALWDSHGQSAGGIAGGVSGTGTYIIEDCNIACVMDVINDVTSNYKWWIYRVSGMIIGNISTTQEIDGRNYANPSNVTCKNVTVTYGDWMNYHYCQGYGGRGWGRVESSDYVGFGVTDHTADSHADGEQHHVCVPFDQLFGGGPNTKGRNPVYGLREYEGVTVNYPATYRYEVSTASELTEALNAGLSVVLDTDIDCGTTQLAITGENQVVDLGGHTLKTQMTYGGIALKNGASIKNGTIEHTATVAAIKAFNVGEIENVTIKTTCATADKTVTAIAVQQGGHVGSIKNVTIEGVSQGIEVGYQATVDVIENAQVNMSTNGTANGIGLVINGGKVGLAKNCTFKGGVYGATMHLKGEFAVGLELQNCVVEGATAAIYAWDEKGISNISGSLNLTYDYDTVLNGELIWDFEDECKEVVRILKKK